MNSLGTKIISKSMNSLDKTQIEGIQIKRFAVGNELSWLPEEFIDKMRQQIPEDIDGFVASYGEEHNRGMRCNTLKISPKRFEELCPYEISPVPWIANGYYSKEDEQPSKHPYYYAGLYYIQEPSAMTPAFVLPVNPGDRVLDLCAAPGGKTTELGAKLMGEGVLVCNDISNSRAKALLKNVEMFGIRNAVVVSESPDRLAERFDGYFDKILVDAPCSGEGMFRKSHAIVKNWQQYGVEYYAKLQREILPSAVRMLKPGGYMVFSTCTFSTEEDEGTLDFIIREYPEMEPVQGIDFENPCFSGFTRGFDKFSSAARIYPHRVRGEGHFVALLRKKTDEEENYEDNPAERPGFRISPHVLTGKSTEGQNAEVAEVNIGAGLSDSSDIKPFMKINSYDASVRKKYKALSDEAFDFLETLGFKIDAASLEVREERIYMLPASDLPLKGLRVLRTGLLLGEMKKGRFEPSQALASALRAEEYRNVLNLSSADERVVRYLKCESIDLSDNESCEDGYCLIAVDGYPLGWGKIQKGTVKNKYLPGWRML